MANQALSQNGLVRRYNAVMAITPAQIQQAVREATVSLNRGNLARADLICQSVLAQEVRPAEILFLLGQIADVIGEVDFARRYFESVLIQEPTHPLAQRFLSERKARPGPRSPAYGGPRFHLVCAWGYGFTADLDHALGHLLLAEMTDRIPVIHWGQNSLFRDADVDNAWPQFFQPVSQNVLADLNRGDLSFFPAEGLPVKQDVGYQHKRPEKRSAIRSVPGIRYLNQQADVTIGDYFTSVIELLPWVRPPHPLADSRPIKAPAIESAYRYLIGKYLHPQPEIAAMVELFAAAHFNGRRLLAVHVRGSDKTLETANLRDGHQKIFATAKAELAADASLFVFLLTDQEQVRRQYMTAFPGRVITTDCQRSSTENGVHYQQSASRRLLGIEVLRDAYLAARCDRFLALGCTNVANFILHLKLWPSGTARLLGPVMHYQRNLLLHP